LRDGLIEFDKKNDNIISAFDPNHPFLQVKEVF
jgi:hypothetical protein